jgi:streptogramin lyase
MDRDEMAVRLDESLGKVEPHPLDHEVIVARAGRRRRRRQLGTIGVGLGLIAIAVVAIAIAGGSSEGPLGPPMVEAATRITLPGEVVGADGRVLDTAAVAGDHLWVLTCSARCGGPPSNFEHSRGTLVEVDSRSGTIVARTPVEGASTVAAGDGGVWTAGFDGTVTHFDARTGKPVGSLHLSLPKPVGDNYPEAFDFLPNHLVVGNGAVWVSTERGYVAEIDPETTRVVRMIPTHFGVSGLAAGGGSVWLAAGLFGLARIDPQTGELSSTQPIEDRDGRRLSTDYLAIGDGSLWARGGWATPHGPPHPSPQGRIHDYVAGGGKAMGLARVDLGSGEVEHLVDFDGYIWIHAVSAGRLWLSGSDWRAGSRDVYVLEPGAERVKPAARLAKPGTIIGAVGSSLWVARPGKTLERYEIPER